MRWSTRAFFSLFTGLLLICGSLTLRAAQQTGSTPSPDQSDATTSTKKKTKATTARKKTPANAPADTPAAAQPAPTPAGPAAPAPAASAKTPAVRQSPPANSSGMVWVNTDSGVYHKPGTRWYGKTKQGKYMSEADAQKAGYRVAGKE